MPSSKHLLAGLGLISAVAGIGPAAAADLFASQSLMPEQKLEFGTGWYIRGDVGWSRDTDPVLSADLSSVANEIKNNWSYDVGAGYQFNNWLRVDSTLGAYAREKVSLTANGVNCPSAINGLSQYQLLNGAETLVPIGVVADGNQCTPQQQATQQKYLLLANGYFDLGHWNGFTPYVGVGAGAAYIRSQNSVTYYNNSDGSVYNATLTLPSGYPAVFYSIANGSGSQTILNPQPHYNYGAQNWNTNITTRKFNFAFALMAGVAFDITTNMKVDLGYRYVNFGSISGLTAAGAPYTTTLRSQELRVGLRYMID